MSKFLTTAFKSTPESEGDEEVVIKSQILAGGRGLGTFTNGFKGGVHVIQSSEVATYADKMLGQTLVTKQSGPQGKPVDTLLIAKKMNLVAEKYFAILLDRTTMGPLIIACSEGGTSIEDLAEKYPEKILKIPVNIDAGITDEQAMKVAEGLAVSGSKEAAAGQIKALYKLFADSDCTMVEVNPLAEDVDGNLIAADAKVGFDDNAAFRQSDIFAQRDFTQEDPREVKADEWDLNYVGLDGNIGCMVNGAGLAMGTMRCFDPTESSAALGSAPGICGAVADGSDPGEPLLVTPFLEANDAAGAREAMAINDLNVSTGTDGMVTWPTSYAGFFTTNQTETFTNYNYAWYFPPLNGNASAPLLVWLQKRQRQRRR